MEGSKTAGKTADAKTLLTKLHELRSSKTQAITESIKKKVESHLAAPTSPCLSTATHDSGLNSRDSTRSLTPREGTPETSPSESNVDDHVQTFRTDKEISGATSQNKERDLQPWEEPGGCNGTLEELSSATGEWDQFKANAELFGYVSTFKDDLSQYSTTIDVTRISTQTRKKAERVAREIELRQCVRGGADEEEPLDAVDEEDLFSAVQREGAEKTKHRQFKEDVQKVPSSKALQTVSGSFFHVDGVGLVDENVVRSNPWMLNKASMQTPQNSGFLSTQPQGAPAAPAGAACGGSMVLSTAPVSQGAGAQAHQASQGGPPGAQASQGSPVWAMPATPQIAPGMAVVLDGLTNTPHFNGLSAMVESYDAETSRYNVQLPIMDNFGAYQVAKIRPENLRIDYRPYCQ